MEPTVATAVLSDATWALMISAVSTILLAIVTIIGQYINGNKITKAHEAVKAVDAEAKHIKELTNSNLAKTTARLDEALAEIRAVNGVLAEVRKNAADASKVAAVAVAGGLVPSPNGGHPEIPVPRSITGAIPVADARTGAAVERIADATVNATEKIAEAAKPAAPAEPAKVGTRGDKPV